MKKRGFTLIELLAVIIIIGVIMLIAIPSVTKYIDNSRKNAYLNTAKEYIKGTVNKVNSGDLDIYDIDTTYYIPVSCIGLETGGQSPYGDFDKAYIVVTYNNETYDYYWISRDTQGIGVKNLTLGNDLSVESIVTGIKRTDVEPNIGIGSRFNIKVLSSDDCHTMNSAELSYNINEDGSVPTITYPEGKDRESVDTGDVIKIAEEEFYLVRRDGNNLVLITKYNLNVGQYSKGEPTGLQDPEIRGYDYRTEYPDYGMVPFSSTYYWRSLVGTKYKSPYCTYNTDNLDCAYVYDENSSIYPYVEFYKNYLMSKGVYVKEARLLSFKEAIDLGCTSINDRCTNAPSFVGTTSYWIGSACSYDGIWYITNQAFFSRAQAGHSIAVGVRPVIVI